MNILLVYFKKLWLFEIQSDILMSLWLLLFLASEVQGYKFELESGTEWHLVLRVRPCQRSGGKWMLQALRVWTVLYICIFSKITKKVEHY